MPGAYALFEAVRAVTLEQIATGEDLYAAILTLSPLKKEVLFHTYVDDMPRRRRPGSWGCPSFGCGR